MSFEMLKEVRERLGEQKYKESVKNFIYDCKCRDCGTIQPYVWENSSHLCKRCFKRYFGKPWSKDETEVDSNGTKVLCEVL